MSNSEIRLAIPAEKVRSYVMDSDTTEKRWICLAWVIPKKPSRT